MTAFLASVKNEQEAELAYRAGADIIDLKNPAQGALGALPLQEITAIAGKLCHEATVSATIGDLPADPRVVLPAVAALQQTGVDIIKIGYFPGDHHALTEALKEQARKQKLVAVLFADLAPDFRQLESLANCNFYGVMLDTAEKNNRGLLGSLSIKELKQFIENSRRHGLYCGLAGQLRLEDIARLVPLQPNYLGFRSALCEGSRNDNISLQAIHKLCKEISNRHTLHTRQVNLC